MLTHSWNSHRIWYNKSICACITFSILFADLSIDINRCMVTQEIVQIAINSWLYKISYSHTYIRCYGLMQPSCGIKQNHKVARAFYIVYRQVDDVEITFDPTANAWHSLTYNTHTHTRALQLSNAIDNTQGCVGPSSACNDGTDFIYTVS